VFVIPVLVLLNIVVYFVRGLILFSLLVVLSLFVLDAVDEGLDSL
jgi:hypothetical protein